MFTINFLIFVHMGNPLEKFYAKLDDVEDVIVKPINQFKSKKKYTDNYYTRIYREKALKKLHVKILKYPKEINDGLEELKEIMKQEVPAELLQKYKLTTLQGLITFAIFRTYFHEEDKDIR